MTPRDSKIPAHAVSIASSRVSPSSSASAPIDLAAALVGSPVGRTPCELQAGDPGLTRVAVKLHTLSGGQPDRRLAVEVSQSVLGVFGSKMVSGVSLDEAESLLELLEEARTRTR